jgi:hypothetical protein
MNECQGFNQVPDLLLFFKAKIFPTFSSFPKEVSQIFVHA